MSAAEKEKYELKEQLRLLRGEMSGDLQDLGVRLNLVQRFQNSFVENQKKWLIGGLIVGSVLAFSSSRRSSRKKEKSSDSGLAKSLFLGLLGESAKQIIKLYAPSVGNYLRNEIEHHASIRAGKSGPIENPLKEPSENF